MKNIAHQVKKNMDNVSNINIVNNNIEHIFLKFLIYAFVFFSIIYLFVLGSMVSNILARKNIESQIRVLSNQVSTLELDYLNASNQIDLTYAYAKGFKETKANFATRRDLGFVSFDIIKNSQNEL